MNTKGTFVSWILSASWTQAEGQGFVQCKIMVGQANLMTSRAHGLTYKGMDAWGWMWELTHEHGSRDHKVMISFQAKVAGLMQEIIAACNPRAEGQGPDLSACEILILTMRLLKSLLEVKMTMRVACTCIILHAA